MNRIGRLFLTGVIVLLAVCLAYTPHALMEPSGTDVVFKDKLLEDSLKGIVKKENGESLTAEDLQKLTVVDLSNKGISDLSGLEHASNLTHLNLSNNKISDVSPLQQMTSMRGLNLSGNSIASIQGLAAMKDMVELLVSSNQITSLDVVRNFPRLHTLSVTDNKISNIDALSAATNMLFLKINVNAVTNIDAIGKLVKIQLLDLSHNRISQLAPLRALTGLGHLNIEGNQIRDISPIKNITNLRSIQAANNQIKDITPLKKLTKLYSIDLNENLVYNLEALSGMTELNYLYLYSNRVWDLSPIQNLKFDFHFDTGAPRHGLILNDNYLDDRAGTVTSKIVQKLNPDYLAPQKPTQRLVVGSATAFVGEKSYRLTNAPFISASRTYMPIRFIATQLGAAVSWNQGKQEVTIIKKSKTIKWVVGEKKVAANGKTVAYDAPMRLKKGSTFLPIRFISEQLDSSVEYESSKKMVIIFDESK
ncbi:leucine-rich repeat domain-containing protein [Paenibacillus sp. PL91]|uniref:leucine-rich repeat domain-containing protein n=1 Tax=Paenibacillus sp. PL91 TaxID=2729538 RepID=UPI00145CE35C|nr:leucine-rich repeat domain-containing protein [Paenibacillus sp. PL91]MBC9203388.1 leucine-rich repeat domain-containing protein [Paenibacillus sp. PL91]